MTAPTHIWGVDVSTKRVAAAFHPSTETRVVEFDKKLRHGARLDDIQFQTFVAALEWRQAFPPLIVFVEQPSGAHGSPQLMYAAGVVQQAIYQALETAFKFPVDVLTITSGDWKKRSVGHGNAGKEQVEAWARSQGCEGESQDELDAFGIAVGGAHLLGRTEAVAA